MNDAERAAAIASLGWADPAEAGWFPVAEPTSNRVLRHAGVRWVAKQFRDSGKLQREISGLMRCAHAAPGAANGPFVPRLVHVDEASRWVVLEDLTQDPCSMGPCGAEDRPGIAVAAAQWLGVLHALPPVATPDRLGFAETVMARLEAAAGRLRRDPRLWRVWEPLADRLGRMTGSLPPLARVYCHRDFEPRNWLFNAERNHFVAIDFEHARDDFAVFDVVRALQAMDERGWKHASTSFPSAYANATGSSVQDVPLFAARGLQALQTAGWARMHGDPVFAAVAERERLRLESV